MALSWEELVHIGKKAFRFEKHSMYGGIEDILENGRSICLGKYREVWGSTPYRVALMPKYEALFTAKKRRFSEMMKAVLKLPSADKGERDHRNKQIRQIFFIVQCHFHRLVWRQEKKAARVRFKMLPSRLPEEVMGIIFSYLY